MAASIFAKTATATGTLQGGRTRLKAGVKTAQWVSSGGLRTVVVSTCCLWCSTPLMTIRLLYQTTESFDDECHVTLTNIDSITGFFG